MSYTGVVHSVRQKKKRNAHSGHQLMHGIGLHAWQQANLAELFESLKNVVCPSTQKTPAKWKILDHAKGFLLEKEAYLSKLLELKEIFLQDDEGPKSLEEVREKYRRLYSKSFVCTRKRIHTAHVPDVDKGPGSSEEDFADEGMDAALQPQGLGLSVSSIQEFEGYLFFYRQTLDHLLCTGVLAPDQPVLPVVSEAISGLWKSMPPEQRAEVQQCTLTESCITWLGPADDTPCSSLNSSQLTSLNTSGTSALEEDLIQDAYDVVQRDMDATTVNSPTLLPPRSGDCERLRETYKDITSFIRSHMSEEQELTQDMCLTDDYEELFLRCSESFDEDI
ncbi:stimulated by retinoic acid gene 8 protein-like isoform X1 [Astyanax mexicanus]|uniref:Stimulated by retinoic acid gene 8 protein-like n=1 Tax=Astyanax mexicanus TaxID=7994 RepID=A0A8B9J7I5_ASTMX|nr:stimulated by retinoic acid gene 8 protein-like isoform X1 [Astyanax mexicanus]